MTPRSSPQAVDAVAAREAVARVAEVQRQALDVAAAAAKRHDDLAAQLAEAADERDEAIRFAAELGAKHRTIAEHVGITRARVAQITSPSRNR